MEIQISTLMEANNHYTLNFNQLQYTIPFNLSMSDTSVVYTVNIQYSYSGDLHNRMRLHWLQREPGDGQGCNVWELGDVNKYHCLQFNLSADTGVRNGEPESRRKGDLYVC